MFLGLLFFILESLQTEEGSKLKEINSINEVTQTQDLNKIESQIKKECPFLKFYNPLKFCTKKIFNFLGIDSKTIYKKYIIELVLVSSIFIVSKFSFICLFLSICLWFFALQCGSYNIKKD